MVNTTGQSITTKIDTFESIEESDLATVGGGWGYANLCAVPFALCQAGLQIAAGIVGACSNYIRSAIGGLFCARS